MAGASSVLSDDSFLSRADRALFRLETLLALISGLAIFALMILAVINVAGRNGFNSPLPGYVDWIEQFMPVITMLGVAYVMRLGGHIRMDILVGQLGGRALWLSEAIATLFMLAVTLLLIWGSWAHFQRSFDFASPLWSRDSSIDIGLPIWPAKLMVPLALSVLCVRLLLQFWGYCRAFLRNDDRPVAVPLIEDAATQAAHEAEHVSGFDEENS
ncbi:TRAP transporter small permease subunit [Aliiruegeria lutimaris]|uniref:TRAP transporter small permease protein n=1 Tax=Aliiruegeria lutimaris TaxID=571298 RepID=A0A1G8JQL7_9RHOB|nr:TRAP transporter small permease [Aliiruegeria lutimaris]SDI33508.1 TRAP-type mannitol/chloroaromatic compound transport system, small permease component [Aliiruegeria lutimaris]